MSNTNSSRKCFTGTVLLMAFALISSESLPAQLTAPPPGPGTSTRSQTSDNNKQKPTSTTSPESTAAKPTPADARKAQILEDTNRLYRMAEELKAEVAKSNKDILSVAVVKKADEIEKLAKSLKERMRSE
jgi:hypothetical protein